MFDQLKQNPVSSHKRKIPPKFPKQQKSCLITLGKTAINKCTRKNICHGLPSFGLKNKSLREEPFPEVRPGCGGFQSFSDYPGGFECLIAVWDVCVCDWRLKAQNFHCNFFFLFHWFVQKELSNRPSQRLSPSLPPSLAPGHPPASFYHLPSRRAVLVTNSNWPRTTDAQATRDYWQDGDAASVWFLYDSLLIS